MREYKNERENPLWNEQHEQSDLQKQTEYFQSKGVQFEAQQKIQMEDKLG